MVAVVVARHVVEVRTRLPCAVLGCVRRGFWDGSLTGWSSMVETDPRVVCLLEPLLCGELVVSGVDTVFETAPPSAHPKE